MIQQRVLNKARNFRGLSGDDVLAALGLERKRHTVDFVIPAVGYFAAGALVGAGLSLLFAPKAGRELRQELGDRARDAKQQLSGTAGKVVQDAQASLPGSRSRKENGGIRSTSVQPE